MSRKAHVGVEDLEGKLHVTNVCDLRGCKSLDDLNALPAFRSSRDSGRVGIPR